MIFWLFRCWLGVGWRNVDVELTVWGARRLDAQQLWGEKILDIDSVGDFVESKAGVADGSKIICDGSILWPEARG